uniref:Protein CUSTOS n=1 Tax=Monopterus albus TaxID=43700 RepID=A0A3Q3K8Q0_MONAL
MAAPSIEMVGVSHDSSSSDDEELKRCQEAVWEARTDKKKGDRFLCFMLNIVLLCNSVVVADHEHDGNELQVTQGFRTHVAKKLGQLLDSYITEMQTKTSFCAASVKCDDDDDDDGFRLFSTSVPGQTAEDPRAPVKRRPVSSSSDSDSEMETRLREAAVTVRDLFPSSTLPSTFSPPCLEIIKKKKKVSEGEESNVVKKKEKTKQNQEEGVQVDSAGSPLRAQRNGEHRDSEHEHTQVKVKRKKEKKQKRNREEKALN